MTIYRKISYYWFVLRLFFFTVWPLFQTLIQNSFRRTDQIYRLTIDTTKDRTILQVMSGTQARTNVIASLYVSCLSTTFVFAFIELCELHYFFLTFTWRENMLK